MRNFAKKIPGVVLLVTIVLLSGQQPAHGQSQSDRSASANPPLSVEAPDLADIIPRASELSVRLADLENRISGLPDVSATKTNFSGAEAELKDFAGQLKRLKTSKDYKYNKLVELRAAVKHHNRLFEETEKSVNQAIHQLGAWRKEWQTEKNRWNEWQSSLLKAEGLTQLKSTFKKANDTIETALALVLPQLEKMLSVQEKLSNIYANTTALAAELNALIVDERHSTLLSESYPMFSTHYFSQFRSGELRHAIRRGLDEIVWPDSRFFEQLGWVVLLQGFFSLFAIIAVYRNRTVMEGSERWLFLAIRPFSAGLFLGYMATVLIYEYGGAPAIWKLANAIVGGISFARLVGGLLGTSWKKQFVHGLIIVLIATRFMDVLSFPLPLLRLYTAITALVGLLFCLRWVGESVRQKDPGNYIWLLRSGSIFFAVIICAELWGKRALASYLFVSLIRSIATVLVFTLFMHMIRGGLEWLFRTSLLRRVASLHSGDTDVIVRRLSRFIDVVIWGLVLLPAILTIWSAYDSLEAAMNALLALGFNLGSQRISFGLLLTSAGILYGSYLISWVLQKLLMEEVLFKRRVERGVRLSMARLAHYAIMLVGFLLALSSLGFEVTKITIMLSALGVGIGFGLQGIVNNFVSGLILLFERPVRVGDIIEIEGKWAEIKQIGLRATSVQTLDQADVIIPNADLVSKQVTNWTLTNRLVRLIIPVGVAYGSDVPLVMETLAASARDHKMVAAFRSPQVLFLSFGESALDFELRVWVTDADHRLTVKSDLHREIDRRFREANIEIAFPQRDLHVRSLDESAILRHQETPR